jgi:hypothetical protein
MNSRELVDEYFIENRTRVLEIAAFLDRLDRAKPDAQPADFRMQAFAEALDILAGRSAGRVTQIQMLLSDPTPEPIEALDRKSAVGAWDRWSKEPRR